MTAHPLSSGCPCGTGWASRAASASHVSACNVAGGSSQNRWCICICSSAACRHRIASSSQSAQLSDASRPVPAAAATTAAAADADAGNHAALASHSRLAARAAACQQQNRPAAGTFAADPKLSCRFGEPFSGLQRASLQLCFVKGAPTLPERAAISVRCQARVWCVLRLRSMCGVGAGACRRRQCRRAVDSVGSGSRVCLAAVVAGAGQCEEGRRARLHTGKDASALCGAYR